VKCIVQVPDVLVMVVDELSHGVHRVDVFYKRRFNVRKRIDVVNFQYTIHSYSYALIV
jgi:hypothetical protein